MVAGSAVRNDRHDDSLLIPEGKPYPWVLHVYNWPSAICPGLGLKSAAILVSVGMEYFMDTFGLPPRAYVRGSSLRTSASSCLTL